MRKKLHEIIGVPQEDQAQRTPEYPAPPDEYNRFAPPTPEEEQKPSHVRKVMLLLAAAGFATLGIFWSGHPESPQPAEVQATATAAATVAPDATPAAGTPQPTPGPTFTPEPTPVVLTGKIQIAVFADAFCKDLGMEGGYEPAVLAVESFDSETFTSYTLPPLPTMDGYTAQGYVLLAESGFDYFNSLYSDGEKPHAIGSVALGDTVTAKEIAIVPPNEEGDRQVEIHTMWTQDNGSFCIEFYDGDEIFNKEQVGYMPLVSEGLIYLAGYPTPVREGLTFNGWYDSTGNKVDTLTFFDFYPPLENAQSMEDRDWMSEMPCRLYASYMDPYGNVQEPSIPLPDCNPIYYQTHSVSNAIIMLSDRWHTTAVHVRVWSEQLQDSVMEYDFTAEDIASGMWEETGIDLNDFFGTHLAEIEALDNFIPPVLEATLTYRLQDGTVGTVQRSCKPQPEEYVFLSYHDDNTLPNEYTFPGCFVAEIFDTTADTPPFVTDLERELKPGEIRVQVNVDNEWIPAENYRIERLADSYEYEGVIYTHYAYYLVMKRPDSFPAHGTATVMIEQRFLHFDYWTTRTEPYTY